MTFELEDGGQDKADTATAIQTQPYILQPLLQDIRLVPDADTKDVVINCVEYWSL